MPIGITEEHVALHESVRGWLERHCPPGVMRASLDEATEARPAFWSELAAQGWLGLHVDEAYGGSGYGTPELVVVAEELGYVCAPGPLVPTMLAAAVVARSTEESARKRWLPGLASGEIVGAVGAGPGCGLRAEETGEGLRVEGTIRPVLGGHLADVLIAPVGTGGGEVWVAMDVGAAGVTCRELPSVDPVRRVGEIQIDGVVVDTDSRLDGVTAAIVVELTAAICSAELVGVAQWCVDTASAYAKERVQFGRPIGQFQGVKHKCADMLGRVELARAAAWDAARAVDDDAATSLATATAISLALDAAFQNAKDCVQVLGGIGFTWEHDAHIYLKRAMTMRSLLGPASEWRAAAGALALAGARRGMSVDLGPEADAVRAEVRELVTEVAPLPSDEQRRRIADAGYISPTWPAPWGRGAKAAEQVVIDEEFRAARVTRPGIMVGAWALPPVIMYGTREQQERWIPPTLRGDITWCQLFSEPGAGSDLASLSTRPPRVDG
ncbi:MAG: acyl-CoA dehydrogenase, partial [Acidimicrobiia bacterium]